MGASVRGIAAGFVMFAASAYLVFAIPAQLTRAGVSQASAFTMTAMTLAAGTILMGLVARRAIVVGPSLPLVAFIIGVPMAGFGFSFMQSLALAMAAGGIVLVLSLAGLRDRILANLPTELAAGITAGVGLLLAADGLRRIGLLMDGSPYMVFGPLDEPRLWLSVAAVMAILALMVRGLQMAVLPVMIVTVAIGITFGFTDLVLSGHVFIAVPPALGDLLGGTDFNGLLTLKGAMACGAVVLFLLLESGSVLSARRFSDDRHSGNAPLADSLTMTFSPLIGSPGAVALPHSSAGWLVGGDERIASLVAGVLFALFAFMPPLAGQLQDYATAPALIVAGLILCTGMREVDFSDAGGLACAFLTALVAAITGHIADGIAAGAILLSVTRLISLDFNRLSPGLIVTALVGLGWLAY
jgi:AGZA family xanthine/uracil permease-like MFS transporter